MSEYLKTVLVAGLLSLAAPAFGDESEGPKFDPTEFLKELEFEAAKRRAAEAIESSYVVIGDRLYLKLASQEGTIYLPKGRDLRRESLSQSLCSTSFKVIDLSTALESPSDLNVVSVVNRSTRVILDALRSRCQNKL